MSTHVHGFMYGPNGTTSQQVEDMDGISQIANLATKEVLGDHHIVPRNINNNTTTPSRHASIQAPGTTKSDTSQESMDNRYILIILFKREEK